MTADRPAAESVLPALPRQRSNRVIALGVAMVGLGALLGWFILTGLNKQVPVVVMTRDVPLGSVLSASDLSTALVSAEASVVTIPGGQLKELIGTVAAADLKKGSLLAPSQVTSQLSPAQGQVLVSVALKTTQIPARGLKSGDRVLVVATPGNGSQNASAKPALAEPVVATVDRVRESDRQGGTTMVIDLIVTADAGVAVTKQASTGLVGLVLQPRAS